MIVNLEKQMRHKTLLILAGGTGGHVFPGLAVAHYWQQQGYHVAWLGTTHGLDATLVPAANIPFYPLPLRGIRGRGKWSLLTAPFKVIKAFWASLRIIRSVKADVILGMGGYVAGPAGIAAWLLRVPLVIHEQNATAGRTNVILSHFARKILQAFPSAFSDRTKAQWVGNPIRSDIDALSYKPVKNGEAVLKILVFGGSQGAQIINRMMPQVMAHFAKDSIIEVWHQTGTQQFNEVKQQYEILGIVAKVVAFIDDMAAAYAWAELVICRAGALSVSELAAAKVASILIPFAQAVDDHQTANARFLVTAKAARVIKENDLTVAKLVEIITELRDNRQLLYTMAENAHQVAKLNATQQVVTICLDLVK